MADNEKFFVDEKDGESWGITIDTIKAGSGSGTTFAASDDRTGVKSIEQSLDYGKDYLNEVERKSELENTKAKYTNKSVISHELVNEIWDREAATRLDADLTMIGKDKDGQALSNDDMVFDGKTGFVEFNFAKNTDEKLMIPTIKGLYLEVRRLQGYCDTLTRIINTEIFGKEDTIKITEKGGSYEVEKLEHLIDNDTTEESSSLRDYIEKMDDFYKFRVALDDKGLKRGSIIWEDETATDDDNE